MTTATPAPRAGERKEGDSSPAVFLERRLQCLGCPRVFLSSGPRAKWCPKCQRVALAIQLLRSASKVLQDVGSAYTAEVEALAQKIAPAGMVKRAEYLAGKSER